MVQATTPLINQAALKNVPDGWAVRSIDSVCLNVTSGGTPSRKKASYWENGTIPWLKTGELKDAYIFDSEEKITEEGLKNSSAKLFPVNTVLMAMYGDGRTITSLGILGREATTNQACCAMIADPNLCHYRYLFYALQYHRGEILSLATGSSQRNLSGQKIKKCGIFLPPLPTQRKIAAVLSAYDDLIENNTRRIAILEEMARRIYREWFVHYRYPGHESVPLVDSPLGPVPQGWEVGRLDDALVLQRGFDLPKRKRESGNIPVYAATGITDYHNEVKVKAPGVLTGRSGSLGTVIYADEDFWPLNTTLWIKKFRRATPLYAFYLLSGMELEKFNSGAAVPTLNRNDIHGLPVVLPSSEMLENFDQAVLPMFELKKTLREKNATLRQTRDLLLPRLISGAVDVSELEIAGVAA